MDRNHTGKRIGVLLLFILIAGAIYFWEENHVRLLFAGISPFPEDDYWNTLVNALLRDVLLLRLIWALPGICSKSLRWIPIF